MVLNSKIIIVHPTINIDFTDLNVCPVKAIDPLRAEEVKKYYNDGEIHHVVCPYIIDYFRDDQILIVGRDGTVLTLKQVTEKFPEVNRYGLQNGEFWASSIGNFHWYIGGEDLGRMIC